jgi:hypothetical protein
VAGAHDWWKLADVRQEQFEAGAALLAERPLPGLFREWVEAARRPLADTDDDDEVAAHNDEVAALAQKIADQPAADLLGVAIKIFVQIRSDREPLLISSEPLLFDEARPKPTGEYASNSRSGQVLSNSLLRDLADLAPEIDAILGPVPFAEAAE